MVTATLPDLNTLTLDALKALIVAQHERLLTREREVEHLKLLLARLQRMQFGRKSEKLAKQIEQLELRLEELQSKPGKTPVQRWNPPSLLIRTLPPPNQPAIRYQDIFRVKRGGMSRRSRHVQIGAGYCASWARMCRRCWSTCLRASL